MNKYILASIVILFAVSAKSMHNRPNTKDYYGLLFMD